MKLGQFRINTVLCSQGQKVDYSTHLSWLPQTYLCNMAFVTCSITVIVSVQAPKSRTEHDNSKEMLCVRDTRSSIFTPPLSRQQLSHGLA